MSHPAPALSIIVPARNAERTLGKSLSVLGRPGHRGCELIVIDDASTDRTAAVAARYAHRVLRLEERRGPAAARNAGVRASRRLWFAARAVPWHWFSMLCASAVFILWAPAYLARRILGPRPARR